MIFYFVQKYRASEGGNGRKILVMGGLLILSWFIMLPMVKPHKLAIEREGEQIYKKDFVDK